MHPASILEMRSSNICLPIFSIIDTNTIFHQDTYIISGNEKNKESLLLFLTLIIKFVYRIFLLRELLFLKKIKNVY